MTDTYLSFPIVKSEETEDGDLLVWGKATDGTIDHDDQIVDPVWSAKALEDWLKSGANVRVQHSPYLYPAGKGIEVATSDEGHWVKALVVEDTAKTLVKKGVLTAFSVGIRAPKTVRDLKAKNGRIVDGSLAEISLVDRPANANCGFTLVKSQDGVPVDAAEAFGDVTGRLQLALANAPEAPVATAFVESAKSDEPENTSLLTDEQLRAWYDERTKHLDAAPEDAESEEWQIWDAVKNLFYEQTPESRQNWVEKKDVDPNVGGGVDRDKIPASDFVDPENRRFPIVTAQDVKDAVSSYGRANPKIPFDKFKARLTAIAKRKGFESSLPANWKDGSSDSDDGKAALSAVEKGVKDCPNCGHNYDADSKMRNCESCGNDLPNSSEKVEKAAPPKKKAPQFQGNQSTQDGDGDQDSDTGDDEDDDEDEAKPKKGAKKAALPYSIKRLHDFLCGVYSDETIAAEYPRLKSLSDALDVEAIRYHLGDEAAELAEALKATDPEQVLDARAQLSKAFESDYPDTHVTPSTVQPGSFRRGYISSGRQRQNASGSDSGARVPMDGAKVPDASDFQRGPLTDGRERKSPSNKGSYSSATYTASMMQSLHDHITDQRSEVCAWLPAELDTQDTNTLEPANVPSKGLSSDEVKVLVDQLVAEKAAKYDEEIARLNKMVDELGAQPDPALSPVRGAVARVDKAAPVEKASEKAEPTYEEKLVQYALLQVDDGNPATRKRAEDVLNKYRKVNDDS
jgi:hypothetical protein